MAETALSSAIEATRAAVAASGCLNVTEFLMSRVQGVKTMILCDTSRNYQLSGGILEDVKKWGVDGLMFESNGGKMGFSMHDLLRAIPCIPSCRTLAISGLELISLDEFSALLKSISSLHLTHLCLNAVHPPYLPAGYAASQIGVALLHNTSLESLSIDADLCSETHFMHILTRPTCSLKSLAFIFFNYHIHKMQSQRLSLMKDIITGLAKNSISLSNFSIACHPIQWDITENLGQILGTMLLQNTSLTSLTLHNVALSGESIHSLFTYLAKNRHLTSLSLAFCRGENWSSTSILDGLQASTTLLEVDLIGTPLEGNSAITAQLARRREFAEQVRLLKLQGMKLIRPTTVRLFLCGLPYSGKTTLSRSLAKWNKRPSWPLASCFSCVRNTILLERTRGIEVTILEEEGQRISLWDLAGQTEYHSFHDNMFPNLSNPATPSMFLYVWNPLELDASGNILVDANGRRRRKNWIKFRDEFKYWLRFIASKTLRSENFRPKLFVAVTRADLGFKNIQAWLETPFTELQKEFQEFIQFDMNGVFEMDARDYMKVVKLASYMFECARSVLEKVPDVFQACDDARKIFDNLVYAKQIPPLVTKERFHYLCQHHLGIETREMREAVALSLNDSGDLIYFKSLRLVVMDTQWFCHHIMGDLLHDTMDTEFSHTGCSQGFFPFKLLESLLENKVNSRETGKWKDTMTRNTMKGHELTRVEGNALVKLLVGLQLACPKDSSEQFSEIFIPATLSGKKRGDILPSKYLQSDENYGTTYLGRRLTCKDSKCTFLTPGIFPLLQVTFHKILDRRRVHVEFEQDVIAFGCDGVKVFVEFCRLEGEDNFIDILVCSRHTLDETIEWVHENVLVDTKKVCAEPRGIPGVELAQAVIRPACVAKLLEARNRQAVPLQELQDVLQNHIQRKGVKLTNDGIRKVIYTWQSSTLPDDYVVDLLGEVETAKVVETYWCGLSEAAREMSNLFVEETRLSELQKVEFGTSQAGKGLEAIYDMVFELRKEMQEGRRDLEKLGGSIQDLRNAVLPKLGELFTFVTEGEEGKLPRMFVVTKDEGIVRRMVSAMLPGLQNLRLELLCECSSAPAHCVDGQRGLSLATVDDGLLKCGLPYISAFLKVAYLAVRVGAHVAVGSGGGIPDFTGVVASVVDSSEFERGLNFSGLADDSRVDFQKGQQWLFDVLSSRNCVTGNQIHAVFGLRRVRHDTSKVAWVCDKHFLSPVTYYMPL